MNLTKKDVERILADSYFDWKDIVIFLMDEHLLGLLTDMSSEGDIAELTEDQIWEMREIIEKEVIRHIGK